MSAASSFTGAHKYSITETLGLGVGFLDWVLNGLYRRGMAIVPLWNL